MSRGVLAVNLVNASATAIASILTRLKIAEVPVGIVEQLFEIIRKGMNADRASLEGWSELNRDNHAYYYVQFRRRLLLVGNVVNAHSSISLSNRGPLIAELVVHSYKDFDDQEYVTLRISCAQNYAAARSRELFRHVTQALLAGKAELIPTFFDLSEQELQELLDSPTKYGKRFQFLDNTPFDVCCEVLEIPNFGVEVDELPKLDLDPEMELDLCHDDFAQGFDPTFRWVHPECEGGVFLTVA